ncbi:MAG: efflux RND transporter periplasmic adaptor subunit, partial [Nitrospiraceae bacterium]
LEGLGAGALPEAQAQARELVAASRRRLELWGLTEEQIRELDKAVEPQIHITIYSPVSGTVMERKVTEGQYVREGDPLYSLSDLSTVWVKADVYESDLPLVRMGQPAEIQSDALPGTTLSGRVSFIEPVLNTQTRTVPVRIQVPNPGLRLRPGMYARAMLKSSMGRNLLAIPRTAVIDTGMKTLVYVAKGKGVFEGREVKLGPGGQEFYPVLEGLKEGERIVTEGNFLIDSQTRLTGGLTGLFGGSKAFGREEAASSSDEYKVTFRTEPSPPRGGAENMLFVGVLDAQGRTVSDAEVRIGQVMPAMPAMGMPEMRSAAELKWNGQEYAGKAMVSTSGSWNVTVEVIRVGRAVATYRTRFTAR